MPPKYVKPTSSLSPSGLQAKYKIWFYQAVTTPCQQVRSNKNAICNGLSMNLLNKIMYSWDLFSPGDSSDLRDSVQKPKAKSKNAVKLITYLLHRPHEDWLEFQPTQTKTLYVFKGRQINYTICPNLWDQLHLLKPLAFQGLIIKEMPGKNGMYDTE